MSILINLLREAVDFSIAEPMNALSIGREIKRAVGTEHFAGATNILIKFDGKQLKQIQYLDVKNVHDAKVIITKGFTDKTVRVFFVTKNNEGFQQAFEANISTNVLKVINFGGHVAKFSNHAWIHALIEMYEHLGITYPVERMTLPKPSSLINSYLNLVLNPMRASKATLALVDQLCSMRFKKNYVDNLYSLNKMIPTIRTDGKVILNPAEGTDCDIVVTVKELEPIDKTQLNYKQSQEMLKQIENSLSDRMNVDARVYANYHHFQAFIYGICNISFEGMRVVNFGCHIEQNMVRMIALFSNRNKVSKPIKFTVAYHVKEQQL